MIVATRSRREGLGLVEALAAWVVARALVFVGYAAADGIASVLKLRGASRLHLDERLLTWDGHWYWLIAHGGYGSAGREGLRFFPLYPLLARALAWPLGGRVGLTLVIVSNAAAFVALVLLRKLVAEESDDEDLARRSMWLFALFPASAAMVLGYAEGLLVMASLVAFLAIRRDRWWLAASAGLVCGLIRPVGLLLVVPFAIEATGHRRASPFARLGAVVAPVIGALSYLFWVGGEYGDWLLPVRVQRELRAGFQDPFTRLWDGFRNLGTSQLDAPNLAFAVIFIGLLVVVFRTQRMSWGFYALATLVVALSAHNINSIGRYGFVAFPFVVAVAKVAEDERVAWAAMAASGAALTALTTMAALGAYQP